MVQREKKDIHFPEKKRTPIFPSSLDVLFYFFEFFGCPVLFFLTSVHWIKRREGIVDSQDVMARIQNWSSKWLVFKPAHSEVVLTHLRQ